MLKPVDSKTSPRFLQHPNVWKCFNQGTLGKHQVLAELPVGNKHWQQLQPLLQGFLLTPQPWSCWHWHRCWHRWHHRLQHLPPSKLAGFDSLVTSGPGLKWRHWKRLSQPTESIWMTLRFSERHPSCGYVNTNVHLVNTFNAHIYTCTCIYIYIHIHVRNASKQLGKQFLRLSSHLCDLFILRLLLQASCSKESAAKIIWIKSSSNILHHECEMDLQKAQEWKTSYLWWDNLNKLDM